VVWPVIILFKVPDYPRLSLTGKKKRLQRRAVMRYTQYLILDKGLTYVSRLSGCSRVYMKGSTGRENGLDCRVVKMQEIRGRGRSLILMGVLGGLRQKFRHRP